MQLPAEGQEAAGIRLTDKFPSDTPIWQILRRFEAGAAGAAGLTKAKYNFTQRATPQMSRGGESGSGRLCYEMPVATFMGREMANFVDLQKTLGQFGFNSGTCLLRLSFRSTDQPLEEAMQEISRYFKEVEELQPQSQADAHGAHAAAIGDLQSVPDADTVQEPHIDGTRSKPEEDWEMSEEPTLGGGSMVSKEAGTDATDPAPLESIGSGPSEEQPNKARLSIYAAPTSSTPAAAAYYNEADYIPTVAHAQTHQARLEKHTRNRRLPSDKEIADQEQAQVDALKQVRDVTVRLRFPDNNIAEKPGLDQSATTADLYAICRELMHRSEDEDFKIRVPGAKGLENLPEDDKRLILDLGWKGRVLVTIVWGEDVVHKGFCLKEEYLRQAQQLKVEPLKSKLGEEQAPPAAVSESQTGKKSGGGDREGKMRGLLSRLSKK